MVRLVFRRYTQIRRSICTSESLRASTSVSAGFTLFRHSSPSFGSQQMRSYSNLSESRTGRSMMLPASREERASHLSHRGWPLLSLRPRVSIARRLAHMLDSLVRVSRRVGWSRMVVSILDASCANIVRQQFERTGVPSATVDMPDRSCESPAQRRASRITVATLGGRVVRARGLTTGREGRPTFLGSLSPGAKRR